MTTATHVTNSRHGYSGAGWMQRTLDYQKPPRQLSEFGVIVADLLGDLNYGIYHFDSGALLRAEWENTRRISIVVRDAGQFGTHDFNALTRLVFLAHEYQIKATIEAASSSYLRLTFHKVNEMFSPPKHPTLQEAVYKFEGSRAE